MPAPSPQIGPLLETTLRELGAQIRARRKLLNVSATGAAESAGMSRVTFHRIERGEPSVTMGAYLSAISALGFKLELVDPQARERSIPSMIRLAEYPQLKSLAWQLRDTVELTPREALELYERNWRHMDLGAMDVREQELLRTLAAFFGKGKLLV